jgi:LPS-assembly lipoprotein
MNIRLLVSLLLCGIITGCGWHLRGAQDRPSNIDSVVLNAASPYSKTTRAMEKQIKIQHIKDSGTNTLHLQLIDEKMKSNTLAFSDSNYPATIEIQLEVRFSVTNAAGETIIAPNNERVVRVYESDSNRRLAGDRELDLIKDELYDEIAINILRRMDYITGLR